MKDAERKQEDRATEYQSDIERARKVQELMRKTAPPIGVGMEYRDPREVQVERLVPEAWGKSPNPRHPDLKIIGGVGAKVSVHYCDAANYDIRIHEGWEPVIENGARVQQGGDFLMKRPVEFSAREHKQSELASLERVKGRDAEADDNEMMSEYRRLGKDKEKTDTTISTTPMGGGGDG